ncbi:MAG: YceI family protein [Gallionella sp.]|nr:YceI family protein [Gallionella sp.]
MKNWIALLLLCIASPTIAAEFSVLRPQQSSVSFVSKQMGVPVEGSFRKFSANIRVDPAKPEQGRARIDIDLTSIDTGNDDANQEVAGRAWFDSKKYPTASFVSNQVKALGKGRYEVLGDMTIKGKTLKVRAPFTLEQKAGALIVVGSFPLKRLDYGIGSGIWGDTEVVADEVQLDFRFTLAQ